VDLPAPRRAARGGNNQIKEAWGGSGGLVVVGGCRVPLGAS
jgi:hypothetical protein